MVLLNHKTHRYIRWVFVIVNFFAWNYDKGMDADKIFYKKLIFFVTKVRFDCLTHESKGGLMWILTDCIRPII